MNVAALARVVRAEIRSLRVSGTILLVVVATLASAALVAGRDSLARAGKRWDAAFAEANGAHVTLYAGSGEALARVVADARVVQASNPYRVVPDVVISEQGAQDEDGDVELRAVASDDLPTVARPLLRSGRWAESADEAVIDRALALQLGIGLGDVVDVEHGVTTRQLVVVGTAVDLIDCFFPQCDPVPVWVDPTAIDGAGDTYLQQYLRIADPDAVDAFVTDVLAVGDVGTADWRDTRADTLEINVPGHRRVHRRGRDRAGPALRPEARDDAGRRADPLRVAMAGWWARPGEARRRFEATTVTLDPGRPEWTAARSRRPEEVVSQSAPRR